MDRKNFLKTSFSIAAMAGLGSSLSAFKKLSDTFPENGYTMPFLFIGHGSPMNGIEHNEFSNKWAQVAKTIPVPKAVLVISAHWLSNGTKVTAMHAPKTIHDFGGFPRELFEVQYPAPGSPALAQEVQSIITATAVVQDHDWGLDHGAWTIVRHMYPKADIPVLQLSIDYNKPPRYHYDLGKQLAVLRKKGVLIVASGNMVHNLSMIDWKLLNGGGFDWALTANELFKKAINSGDHKALIDYEQFGTAARLAVPTPDHYYPLLYVLGIQTPKDNIAIFNDKAVGGSLTMTSVQWGKI